MGLATIFENVNLFTQVFLAFLCATAVESACPNATIVSPCSCVNAINGVEITCYVDRQSPNVIQYTIRRIFEFESIVKLSITNIDLDPFNYVPTDMFSGFPIPDVTFQCTAPSFPLSFSINSFISAETGLCTLTGRFVIDRCNVRQINGDMFNWCNKLETLAFTNSLIEEFIRVPKLNNLKNLTISPRPFSSDKTILEISELPQLTYLNLAYNSLSDNDIAFISNCSKLQEVYLSPSTEINYSHVPDLTNLPFLTIFQIPLGPKNFNVSLLLPNPRRSNASLNVTIESTLITTRYYYITELKGNLNCDLYQSSSISSLVSVSFSNFKIRSSNSLNSIILSF